MTPRKRNIIDHDPRRVLVALIAVIAVGVIGILRQAWAQKPAAPDPDETYRRPDPTVPFTPQIPSANRYKGNLVFLENADSIIKPPALYGQEASMQVVKGNVKFRQMGMWLYCDSAYYFPDLNSMDAFGHVRMEQGDTLFVYADRAYYDGMTRFARLRCGESEPQVRLINRKVRLTTDSLDYDLEQDLGWYEYGGRLEDDVNVLTSRYGRYSPSTDNADFFHDVVLHGTQNNFHLYTDTLYYNTSTHIARIETPTRIDSDEDDILTSNGFYNTQTGIAELLSRSTVFHTDSLGRTTTLEGDSIVYDPETRISRAYSFRDRSKHPSPMVITDTARKAILVGGFGFYNDITREAMATDYPLMMEYSRGDTLFLRADTIRTWEFKRPQLASPDSAALLAALASAIPSDSVSSDIPDLPTDSLNLTVTADTVIFRTPEGFGSDEVAREEISSGLTMEETVVMNPSDGQPDYNPEDPFRNGATVEDQPENESVEAGSDDNAPEDKSGGNDEDVIHMAKAYPRARFFRKDIQGIADTIIFTEIDSILRLERLPVVWSDERQVRGDTIIVHLNDSTADYAIVPSKAMLMEYVEEDFYNQLHADWMQMWFTDSGLRRLEAEGSVQTIMIPQESDSTYNRLVDAESSSLIMEMDSLGRLQRLKMWPEVTGNVTPIFLVKRSQMFLPKAAWLEALRPKREWYGGSLVWDDDLGELTPELEAYFESGAIPSSRPNPAKLRREEESSVEVTQDVDETQNSEAMSTEESEPDEAEEPSETKLPDEAEEEVSHE